MQLGPYNIPTKYWDRTLPDPINSGCLIWTGWRSGGGYGQIRINMKTIMAYRYFYEKIVGPIPEGMVPDHLCENPSCVLPEHMELVSQAENVRRNSSHPYRRNYDG